MAPVGVVTVNTEGPSLLVAWKSLYEYDIDTDGYYDGDDIELRLYSQALGRELMVMANLNADHYGDVPITIGQAHVLNDYLNDYFRK